MTRTVSATITAAVGEVVTQPVYLIDMGWDAVSPDINRKIATWASDITWNSSTWQASGASVQQLTAGGGRLRLPNGDGDPWLALATGQITRGRSLDIYEYHTDFTASPITSDAVQVFSGIMEGCSITQERIEIDFIEGLLNKSFPQTSIDPTVYTHLLSEGQRIYWGPDVVLVVKR